MGYMSGSLVIREAALHPQQTNIVSDTSESPEKRPSLQQDNIMPDKMTKLKKSKKPKEREPDEAKARGEVKEKKQKKRHSQQPPPSAPPWIWWLAGGPNQRKKRSSHKSSKEKSSSKKHSTKERSTDKKKTTTTTTRRKKHREDESENEDDIDETNSAAGDLGVDDGENDYGMMLGQAKQSNKNHTWIDEHRSSVGSDRTNYPMPARDRTPLQSSGDTGFTRTNGERELATRHQGGHPETSRRQDDFQSPTVQDDDETTNRQNICQTSPTSTTHQQSPAAPENDFTATSQENSTDNIDADHGTLPTIQEEPPKSTSHQSNTKHTEQEQNTTTAGRDTAPSSGDECGVTDMGGDEQASKESASPQAGENEPKIPESTDTTSKRAEHPQVKEQVIESNDSQGNQQTSQGSDESRVNENESTESGQSSSCTVT